jgi:uncharacterized protein (UPF0332 family)
MPFDWETYKTLADNLRQRNDEASQRSAISRLYYSVYWQARIFLEENQNYLFSENKEPHAQIWHEFIRQGKSFRFIGNKGKELRDKRNKADYSQEISDLRSQVETSFIWADQILTELAKIKPKDEN